jgi:hypothetical protein
MEEAAVPLREHSGSTKVVMWAEREEQERIMKARLLIAAAATVLIGTAVPVFAEEIGVGVGPVGVTVGEGHKDRDVVREREVIRDRDGRRDHDRDTVVIKKGDRDRDVEHRTIIKDRD